MFQSPLNYTGGKYKLLPQILPLFPDGIDTFLDLFCGGCSVGLNVTANTVIYNDFEPHLYDLFGTFKNLDKSVIFDMVYNVISQYGLSLVSEHGYDYYGCASSEGLGSYNRERFLRLRNDYNTKLGNDYAKSIMLYVLIVYAFNNQIRFNRNGEFNLPVGKRDFNGKMAQKLSDFLDRIHSQQCAFISSDFHDLDMTQFTSDDFVYADPPYLITCASYNEQNGWNETDERDLLTFLDDLDRRNIRFALSNVLRSKGKENSILLEWTSRNADKYRVIPLDYNYSNSNYHTKDRQSGSEEVLIINYGGKM